MTLLAQMYDSTMSGAPSISGQAGTLISVLKACLQDGFGQVTLDSLVVSGNVATCTKSGHGFAVLGGAGSSYPIVRIAGATPSGLNGDFRLTGSTANTFTFATSGISDQTATGTITAKRAPAGFTEIYSGTNKSVMQSNQAATYGWKGVLRIDDSPTQYPTLIMYESATGVDTGSGPTPATSNWYMAKSSVANSTARAWRLFADPLAFYLFVNADASTWGANMFFGHINSYRAGDAYHCALIAHSTAAANSSQLHLFDADTAAGMLRIYDQSGATTAVRRYSHKRMTGMGYGGEAYRAAADNAFHCAEVELWEAGNTRSRGTMPGLYCPLHDSNPADGTVESDVSGLSGHDLFVQQLQNANYRAALDLTHWNRA